MTSVEPKTGMPGWLKIVLIVAAVFVVATAGLLAVTFFTVGNMYKDAIDPIKMKQVVASFMTTKDPLPEGYHYKFALDLLGNKIVNVESPDKDLQIVLANLKEAGDITDPEKAINKVSSHAATAGQKGGHATIKFDCEKKGSELVGGRKMSYAIGKSVDDSNKKENQVFIGLFEPTATGTALIFGSTSKPKYDMVDTETFLKSIEKI